MRVAIFGSQNSIHIVRWANALADKGIEVHLLTLHDSVEQLDSRVVVKKLRFGKPFGYFLNVVQARIYLGKIKPDFVHAFYALGYGMLARLASSFPILVSVMGSDVYDDIKNPLFKSFVESTLLKAEMVCSTSHIMLDHVMKTFRLKRDKVRVTPFGVETSVFHPCDKEESKTDETFIIGTIKKLEYKYGVDTLIESFSLLVDANPDINLKLRIIGSGKEKRELEKMASEFKIAEKCKFVDHISHSMVPEELCKLDVFVALSRLDSESFGVAILEACSVGKPVVVSNAGGLKEVVINNETGIIVDKENPIETRNAIDKLLKDNILRDQLSINARVHIKKHYEWSDSVGIMYSIYQEMINRKKVGTN